GESGGAGGLRGIAALTTDPVRGSGDRAERQVAVTGNLPAERHRGGLASLRGEADMKQAGAQGVGLTWAEPLFAHGSVPDRPLGWLDDIPVRRRDDLEYAVGGIRCLVDHGDVDVGHSSVEDVADQLPAVAVHRRRCDARAPDPLRPDVHADSIASGALQRQAEEAQRMPDGGHAGAAGRDVAEHVQCPLAYLSTGDEPGHFVVGHGAYGFLARTAFLITSTTSRSVKDRGRGRSIRSKSLRTSSTVGSSLSGTALYRS